MAYWRNENTADLRRSLGFDHLDLQPTWRRPGSGAPPATITVRRAAARPAPAATPASPHPAPAEPAAATAAATPATAEPPAETPIVQPTSSEPKWAYPGVLQLLAHAPSSGETSSAQQDWLARTATATKTALQQLQLQARLLDSGFTPNSALLRFAGNANLTVDQVLRKRSELLTTFGLRRSLARFCMRHGTGKWRVLVKCHSDSITSLCRD
jgi:S-DNA-T family DNA segregation ATPase FtsK/SpoIIIE